MKEYFIIYKTINTITNKIYIGCHRTFDLADGYMGSGNLIRKAIQKYGRDKFIREIMFVFDNYEEMINKEREIVNDEFVRCNETYNLVIGGSGDGRDFRKKPTTCFKTKGIKRSEATKNKFRGTVPVRDINGNRFKVSVNDERYLSGELIHTSVGMKRSDQVKDKISKKAIGRKVSEETKKKIANSMMGEKNHFYGKTHSVETIEKIRRKNVGRVVVFSDEHRKNLSLAAKRRYNNA